MSSQDQEFVPSIDMIIQDYDIEETLAEEERLATDEHTDPNEELEQLQKEQDMPLDQLLSLYYNQPANNEADEEDSISQSSDESSKLKDSALKQLYPIGIDSLDSIIIAAEESDTEYEPDDPDKKKIMIGEDHQASIPDYGSFDGNLYNDNADQLLWSCFNLSEDTILDYLKQIMVLRPVHQNTVNVNSPTLIKHLRDDEDALSIFQICQHNSKEAVKRFKIEVLPSINNETALWTEEECKIFENSLLIYGKNFSEIQKAKLHTKKIGDIIKFYYHWKKSERYDAFISEHHLDKKKHINANAGLMDRFLDEQQHQESKSISSGMLLRDRTVSNCLLSADSKRRIQNKQDLEKT